MGHKPTSKKGITVPKPMTVSIRKYNELKAKYEALQKDNDTLRKALEDANSKLQRTLKTDDGCSSVQPRITPVLNQEFHVLNEIVNLIQPLSSGQRKTVIAGLLSSIRERTKARERDLLELYNIASTQSAEAAAKLDKQREGMREMAEIISNYGK